MSVVTANKDGLQPGHQQWRSGIDVYRVGRLSVKRSPIRRGLDQFALAARAVTVSSQFTRPDVIYAYSPPLTLGLSCIALSGRFRCPYVFNAQDLYPQALVDLGVLKNPALIWLFRFIERQSYLHASRVVVHSPGNARLLLSRGIQNVDVVENWVDVQEIHPGRDGRWYAEEWGLTGKFVVLFAGVIGYAQGLEVVLEAARIVASETDDVLFLIVGDGSRSNHIKAMAREMQLTNVLFRPLQPPEKYPDLLAAANVGLVTLHPSVRTPVVPSKVASIMAAGKPVIAAVPDQSDTRDLVEAAKCGLVVSAGDPQSLAKAVLTLYQQPSLASKMGAAGRRYAEEHLAKSVVLDHLVRLLEETARGVRGTQ
ncbi:MAG TPA: glycosyltransferase family 4 protein [Firmicutes bacterium]|nr:glycosyltransferase family 4 protein [Bacillota bacterium]